ncbi:hypothetical protein B0J14DRAFT_629451 [Halenospora varia]|nr:hypothetical protein B0J14DRAFT_629451 [Halenospora varia]
MAFKKLARFEDGGSVHYGDVLGSDESGYLVQKLNGNISSGFEFDTSKPIRVDKLLCPLEKTPLVICIGLNYRKHAEEASLAIPKYPVVFTKPASSLAGSNIAISIHPAAQSMLDFEGELTFVVSQDVKNLSGNFSLGGQFCFAKSFDGFAPIGPYIISPDLVPDPQKLQYVTRVNGVVKQETGTDDMIWNVKDILRHLSQGTTIQAGTVVMTGTPSGIGFFRKEFLKDGDVVEVEFRGLLKLVNTMKFE